MQHENWIRQAKDHWAEFLPEMTARLEKSHQLEAALQDAATATSAAIRVLMARGATWQEAWEQVREQYLFPPAEPGAVDEAPESEGYKAQVEYLQGLGSLRMPGEADPTDRPWGVRGPG